MTYGTDININRIKKEKFLKNYLNRCIKKHFSRFKQQCTLKKESPQYSG